jgi:uncharacterized protein YajQ (UPF0234 family)
MLKIFDMTTTVKVTYTAQGSPDTIITFDLTGIDLESIKKELPQKKKELDSKFDIDPHKSSIEIDNNNNNNNNNDTRLV